MKMLLISTLPNRVYDTLSEMANVELSVIDLSSGLTRQSLYSEIRMKLTQQPYNLLLTYRCPYIIPQEIYSQFRIRLNIHPLPLPEYAGLNPWERFLNSGHRQAEAVLHHLEAFPDAGGIVRKQSYSFNNSSDAREVADTASAKMVRNLMSDFKSIFNFDLQIDQPID